MLCRFLRQKNNSAFQSTEDLQASFGCSAPEDLKIPICVQTAEHAHNSPLFSALPYLQPSLPDAPTRALSPNRTSVPITSPGPGPVPITGRSVRSPDLFPPRHQITVPNRPRPESALALTTPAAAQPVMAARAAHGQAPGSNAKFSAAGMAPRVQNNAARGPPEPNYVSMAPRTQPQMARAPADSGYATAHAVLSAGVNRGPNGTVGHVRGSYDPANGQLLQNGPSRQPTAGRGQNGDAPPLPPYPRRLVGRDGRTSASERERSQTWAEGRICCATLLICE